MFTTAPGRSPRLIPDKGIDGILGKAGHKQSAGTTEKISDGVRSLFKKVHIAFSPNSR
jgi:hypothetical protein